MYLIRGLLFGNMILIRLNQHLIFIVKMSYRLILHFYELWSRMGILCLEEVKSESLEIINNNGRYT